MQGDTVVYLPVVSSSKQRLQYSYYLWPLSSRPIAVKHRCNITRPSAEHLPYCSSHQYGNGVQVCTICGQDSAEAIAPRLHRHGIPKYSNVKDRTATVVITDFPGRSWTDPPSYILTLENLRAVNDNNAIFFRVVTSLVDFFFSKLDSSYLDFCFLWISGHNSPSYSFILLSAVH
jgi:hypothetical protein